MDHRLDAHLEISPESLHAGETLAYRIVNDGDRAVGYGAGGVAVEHNHGAGWVPVPLPGAWYAAWRMDIAPGETGRWMEYELPARLADGRYRLVKSVHPPFERQGIQPVVHLSAEFVIE